MDELSEDDTLTVSRARNSFMAWYLLGPNTSTATVTVTRLVLRMWDTFTSMSLQHTKYTNNNHKPYPWIEGCFGARSYERVGSCAGCVCDCWLVMIWPILPPLPSVNRRVWCLPCCGSFGLHLPYVGSLYRVIGNVHYETARATQKLLQVC